MLGKYVQILKINLRHELLPHLCLAILLCAATPVIFGLNDLDSRMAAIPLETVVALTGPILLIPIFLLEQDSSLADIMYTKRTPPYVILMIRTLYSLVFAVAVPFIFVAILRMLGSDVSVIHLFNTVSSALFLGGTGMLILVLCKNIAAGYMVPAVWYALSMGAGGQMGTLDIMAMMRGQFDLKLQQLILGLTFIAAAVIYRSSRRALR